MTCDRPLPDDLCKRPETNCVWINVYEKNGRRIAGWGHESTEIAKRQVSPIDKYVHTLRIDLANTKLDVVVFDRTPD
jgi:hypothetical protein